MYFFSDLCHCRCRTLCRRPCRPCRTFFIPAGPVSSLLPDLSCRPAMIFDFVPAGPVSASPLSLPDLFCRPCHTVPVEPVSSPPDLCNCPCWTCVLAPVISVGPVLSLPDLCRHPCCICQTCMVVSVGTFSSSLLDLCHNPC